jgi:prevent-host-death family protein
MIMTMIVVNIFEAKAKLSEYLEQVARGERVVICKRNRPIAELRAVEQARPEPRPIGAGPFTFDVPESFFAPLPDDFLAAFESGPVYPATVAGASRVAGRPKRFKSDRRQRKR